MKYIPFIVGLAVIPLVYFASLLNGTPEALGVFSNPFLSIQLSTTTATSGYVLSTDGINNLWIANTGGGGGGDSTLFTWSQSTNIIDTDGASTTATTSIKSNYFTATSTTGASTFPYASSTAVTATNFWGTASLATSLVANGSNCSSGNAPLGVDALGAVESCFDVWTEAENTSAGYLSTVDISANTNLTGGVGLTLTNDDMACDTASGSVFGCLSSTDWNIFNNKLASTSIDTSAELATILTDETGTAGNLVFSGNPLLAGFRSSASSTIGDGTGAGGLTINGGATTTGTLRVGAPFANESGELRVNGSVFASDSFNIPGLTKLSLGSLYNSGTFNLVGYNGTSPVNLLNTQGAGTTGIGVNFPSGNVGIGTTSPSRKLTIQGGDAWIGGNLTATGTATFANYTATNGTTTNATSTSFFSALGTFTNMVVNTLATFLNVVVTGLLDVGGGVLEIPNGTAPTADDPGELAFDTTDNMLIIDDFAIPTKPTLFAWSHGSTSPKFATSTTWYVPTVEDGYVVTDINCKVTGGTSKVLTIYGETLTCDADGAVDDGTITIATVGAGSTTVAYTMGAGVGNVNDIIITVSGRITRE